MANGTTRVTEKEVLDSAQQADYFVAVKDGKVKLAEPGSFGDITVTDEDDSNKEYYCALKIRDGHLVIVASTDPEGS